MPRKEVEKPKHLGLQLHRLSSLFKGGYLENMIDRWNKAQEEGLSEIQNVINSVFGEPWVNRVSEPESERVAMLNSCKMDYERLEVPQEAVCLCCGVDVQQNGFWYRIRAFAPDTTSWGIDEGFLSSWEELSNMLFADYGGHRIWRVLIDTGGGKNQDALISRTEETYNFIRENLTKGLRALGIAGVLMRS